MDGGDMYYMDIRKHHSTRRYIYEGFGGQKHDKTLILHKSESNPDDTIILRLCKRVSARLSWSSCFRGKLLFATLLALLATLCYFNLFSEYLPQPCGVFSSSANRKLKSLANETVLIRSKNSFGDDLYDLLNPSNSNYVSEFTKKVALDMHEGGITTTIFRKYSEAIVGVANTVIYQHSVTTSPTKLVVENAEEPVVLQQSIVVEVALHQVDQWKTDPMPLISRLIQSRRVISLN